MNSSEKLMAQVALAAKLANRIPIALHHPAIRRRHLECLMRFLIQRAVAADEILVELRLRGSDETTIMAVHSVQQLWSSLLQLVERRLEGETVRSSDTDLATGQAGSARLINVAGNDAARLLTSRITLPDRDRPIARAGRQCDAAWISLCDDQPRVTSHLGRRP